MTTSDQEKQERYKKFREFITFEDIFSLALAYTSIQIFSSDNLDWHKAVYEICEKHKQSIPELERIFFDHSRPPLPPMAEEIYTLRFHLMICKELEGLDTLQGYILRIPDGARPKIIRREEELLAKYLEQIRDMAEIFDKHLKIGDKK